MSFPIPNMNNEDRAFPTVQLDKIRQLESICNIMLYYISLFGLFFGHRLFVITFTTFLLKNILLYEYPCRIYAICRDSRAMYGIIQ